MNVILITNTKNNYWLLVEFHLTTYYLGKQNSRLIFKASQTNYDDFILI